MSENYYIFVENPMKMDFWKFISEFGFGKASLVDCLYHDTAKPQKVSFELSIMVEQSR